MYAAGIVDRVAGEDVALFFCKVGQLDVEFFEGVQFFFTEVFDIHEPVACALGGSDQLIELEVKGQGIPVLGLLDDEYHEEGNNGSACVDDQLPGIGEFEYWAGNCPDYNGQQGDDECARSTCDPCDISCEPAEVMFLVCHKCCVGHGNNIRFVLLLPVKILSHKGKKMNEGMC